ncbi:uncharacterized protein TrAFT101_008107 [Trichoderma asperellum]|uniref:Methyltransferase domain-containing protein n=1 Tax=Trichoderma asperellum (strain ATCC 204424 / CBS 433.97 / NBRC 101777) TaxID=1042311 RepID=A0A2T3Z2R7_TRIA4|nr:hypothetical protein M441DRAFT_144780 [Trichoderma asperellum CBS 433.97]PTB39092.1 hypothetical protein M441DRAFT_144780 [Trichoderma asperellum CBS 433.97]UKZ93185.1 hypothetical protein TrAFT101_008107 [Trichoderma asperellum]
MDHEATLDRWKRFTYVDNLPEDISYFRNLLEKYSNIPPEDIDCLLLRTRERLWEVAMYPCIGRWSFLNLQSVHDPHFYTVVQRLRDSAASGAESSYPEALLDIGCCVGQLLRKLVHDGIDPTRLFGTDLHPEFISIGAELFRDEGCGLTFAAGDMLDPRDEDLNILDGKITLVHAGNFFHLFTWEEQVVIGMRIVRFLHPGTIDAIIFGRQIGSHNPRERQGGRKSFLHNEESLQRLWNEVGVKTGTRWRVQMNINEERVVDIPGFGVEDRYVRFGIYQFPLRKAGTATADT